MTTTWKRIKTATGVEYVHQCGARVYGYPPVPFQGREWGCQKSTEKTGSGGFRSMREAMQFIERHDPAASQVAA